jgi:predicted adenine nucleotide alpha hydrolase (AANH) superfamily ATPase
MKRVLLHICCGVCSLHSLDKLINDGYAVTGFFFNPNIFPHEEYLKRLNGARLACELMHADFIEGDYDHQLWQVSCRGHENAREGGERCLICYGVRLQTTFNYATQNNFGHFTTTLTISPHKDAKAIFEIGRSVGKERFLAIDFKKQDGFKKSMDRAKKENFYRQNYCGCEYGKMIT